MWVRTTPDAEPRYAEAMVDRATGEGVRWRAERPRCTTRSRTYRFALEGGPCGYRWLNGGGVYDHDVPDVEDFRIVTFAPPPSWLADRVAYQIFPDRFASSGAPRHWPSWATVSAWDDPIDRRRSTQQLYGGDLAGIEAHLDHIERLGVNLLYLTPFFPARVEPPLQRLHLRPRRSAARRRRRAVVARRGAPHRRGIRVIGDITANHTRRQPRLVPGGAGRRRVGRSRLLPLPPPSGRVRGVVRRALAAEVRPRATRALRRRLVDGPDSVVGRFLAPDVGLDGWRVDVANMAGRFGERRRQPRGGADDAPHHGRRSAPTPTWWPSTATTPTPTCSATAGTAP